MSDTGTQTAPTQSAELKPCGQGSFIWYELMTTDPTGAKAFYDAVVGWDIEADAQSGGPVEYRMIRRSDGNNAGGVLKITDAMAQGGARPVWLGYIQVDDVDASVASIQQAGGSVLMPPSDAAGVGPIAMVADPQGAPFYVMRPEPPTGQPEAVSAAFSTDEAQHVRWNELSSSDAEAAIDFYTRQFGWRQEGDMDMGEYGKYRFLYEGDTMIGAIMPKMPDMPVSLWSYYIGVDDIDRAAKAVSDGGGQIFHGPMEIPGGEFSINGMDPQGAAFGLVGPRKS